MERWIVPSMLWLEASEMPKKEIAEGSVDNCGEEDWQVKGLAKHVHIESGSVRVVISIVEASCRHARSEQRAGQVKEGKNQHNFRLPMDLCHILVDVFDKNKLCVAFESNNPERYQFNKVAQAWSAFFIGRESLRVVCIVLCSLNFV